MFSRLHAARALPLMPRDEEGRGRQDAALLRVDVRWRPEIERACELKEALDHALRWKQPDNDGWLTDVLKREGIALDVLRGFQSDASYGADMPAHFASLLVGRWFTEGILLKRLVGFESQLGAY